MPPQPMSGPDPSKPAASALGRALARSDEGLPSASFETDFAELAAKFAAHSGGTFSSELSAELALEIVFNEIVEQACLATGATGAAIVLERDGEMVCRASSGSTAPDLGSRLDSGSGLSGECVRTRRLCRCDDAQADPRADIEASRRLGVRSVMVLPLLRNWDLIGVIEIFSSRPGAFGERDEHTLGALARRVLKNLERAAQPIPQAAKPVVDIRHGGVPARPDARRVAELPASVPRPFVPDESREQRLAEVGIEPDRRGGFDFITWTLGAAVLACALLLGVLVGQHMGWQKTIARARAGKASGTARSAPAGSSQTNVAETNVAETSSVPTNNAGSDPPNGGVAPSSSVPSAGATPGASSAQTSVPGANRAATGPFPPAGSLRVYENGKEVFRLPAVQSNSQKTGRLVELSPAAAEGSLLHRVEPDYPAQARQQQIEGPVVLDVHIGQDGSVQEIKLVSGPPLLGQAATDAVKQWRFKPRTVAGRPVEMQTKIILNFRLPH